MVPKDEEGRSEYFLKDALFFPVNFVHTHWSLLMVYPLEKRIDYLDSMNSHPHAG
jgi:Ulp1 family protease